MAETPSGLDLTRFSESTRRTLYEWIAGLEFAKWKEAPAPDDSGLQVVYFAGRWFATWTDLEEPIWQPTSLRVRILRVGTGSDQTVELFDV
jgi:hypothetical protein